MKNTNKTFYYARVSTKEQNLDRQLKEAVELGIDERDIYTDKASGKNFDREGYNAMIQTVRPGDTIVIHSIDRLGRDYTQIMEEWNRITKDLECNIRVLDMPLLDTSADTNNLDKNFIADLVLQILSYVAEKERQNIKARQAQGIASMPTDEEGYKVSAKTGRRVGRPKAEYPKEWEKVYQTWKDGKITATSAMEQLELKRTTFYALVKKYEEA